MLYVPLGMPSIPLALHATVAYSGQGLWGSSYRTDGLTAGRPVQVDFEKPDMNMEQLMKYGNLLVDEQENVRRVQLADSYLKGAELVGAGNGATQKSALLS